MTRELRAATKPTWFICPKWQTRSIVPPCTARIAKASAGTVPGETAPDYEFCLTCPDSVVVQDKSEPKQNKRGRTSKGRYDRKPERHPCDRCKTVLDFTEENFPKTLANKFGLAYICRICANIVRAEHKATEWDRK